MQLLLFHESNCAGKPTCARDSRKEVITYLALCSKKHSVMARALLLGVREERVLFKQGLNSLYRPGKKKHSTLGVLSGKTEIFIKAVNKYMMLG